MLYFLPSLLYFFVLFVNFVLLCLWEGVSTPSKEKEKKHREFIIIITIIGIGKNLWYDVYKNIKQNQKKIDQNKITQKLKKTGLGQLTDWNSAYINS